MFRFIFNSVISSFVRIDVNTDSSSYDSDEVTSLAAEDAGGESDVGDVDIKVLDPEPGLEQQQQQSELGILQEEREDPGEEVGKKTTGEEPYCYQRNKDPGKPHDPATNLLSIHKLYKV